MKTTDQIVQDTISLYAAIGGDFAEAEKKAAHMRDMNSEGTASFAFWNAVCEAFHRAATD